ncbi:sarcosine oxidase subunit delta [Alsobacter sp. KACC 23698]|uniref:Sarcosine oxidase subunit delta n=1 Tax=Alsobacter sp. KACC 23698 TaxID=3149229 RepID=A0AAU7JKJ4_9HYPH
MRIACPHCGSRDAQEFTYRGDAAPRRPSADAPAEAMFDYVYLRDNPAGPLRELWRHSAGCHAWLVVTRDTRTHAISDVQAARPARKGAAA